MKWIVALLVVGAESHGFIVHPKTRGISGNWQKNPRPKYFTEPQSLGAAGPGDEIGVCGRGPEAGDLDAGTMTHLYYGPDDPRNDPITTMTPGQPFEFKAKITAHHMGHMTVRICPFIEPGFSHADLADCYLVQGQENQGYDFGPFWFLSPNTGEKTWIGMIPQLEDLPESQSGLYTVQWRWQTANSCNPYPAAYACAGLPSSWCGGECAAGVGVCPSDLANLDIFGGSSCTETHCCSEVFTNCATVAFVGKDYSLPGSAGPIHPEPETPQSEPETPQSEPETPQSEPETPQSEPETPQPEPESNPEADAPAGALEPCVRNPDCATNAWCQDESYDVYCPRHTDGDCPNPQCTRNPATSLVQSHQFSTKFAKPVQAEAKRHATVDGAGYIGLD